MKKLLALGLSFITLCSFMCTKSNDDVVMRSQIQQNNTVTIDMSQFPARTQFIVTDENNSSNKWTFDSDSIKVYHANIPSGSTYTVRWRLIGLTEDARYKAFIRYHDKSSVNADWKSDLFTQKGWKMWGTYTFTKELK